MNILETYYTYAKLSQVAYIDLSNVTNPLNPQTIVDTAILKEQERVTEALAKDIFSISPGADATDTWTMLSPYYRTSATTGHSDPTSGFAAMLLSNSTYGKVLSIAGTEPTAGASQFLDDLMFSDLGQIGLMGGAFNQLVSLFNYVQELKAATSNHNVLRLEVHVDLVAPPAGTPYIRQDTVYSNYYWLEAHYDGQGQGLIAEGEQLTVTGHSLGGHVAALAVALFPETFTTAYTFNAPGYNPLSSLGVQPEGVNGLLNLFKQFGANPLTVGSSTFTDRVITLEAEDAIPGDDNEVVSSSATGTAFSPEIYITTEKVTHDIGHMTESLALQFMFTQLDSKMTEDKVGSILAATTAQPLETYEKLLLDLNLLLTGTAITLESTGPSTLDAVAAGGGDFTIRSAFFDSYFGLQANAVFKALIGKVEITAPPTAPEARADLGAFLCLYYLTPFAFKIEEAGARNIFYEAHAPIAALWNADRNLTPEQIANGEAHYSDTYLADRAAMLGWVNKLNAEDFVDPNNGFGYVTDAPSQHFEDRSTGQVIDINKISEDKRYIIFGENIGPINADTITGGDHSDHLYGLAGADTLNGGKGDDYLEGGTGNDTLNGNEDRDTLLGGDGEDILNGGTGNDQLKGGAGVDIYQLTDNYGMDVITDIDGSGVITVNNTPVNGGTRLVEGIYYNTMTHTSYALVGNTGHQTLYIRQENDDSNQIIVNDWSTEHNLNINLDAPEAAPDATLVGDFKKKIDDHHTEDTSDDTYVITDGNYTRDPDAVNGEPGALDLTNGTNAVAGIAIKNLCITSSKNWRIAA